jgi:hypothetical protein
MDENRRKTPPPLDQLTQEEKNEIIGAAIDAWLEKKWASFGKWTAGGVAASAFGTIMYYIATHGGFGK